MLALSAFLIASVLVASHRTVSRVVPTLAVAPAYVAWHQATLADAVGVVRPQRDKLVAIVLTRLRCELLFGAAEPFANARADGHRRSLPTPTASIITACPSAH